MVHTYPHPFPLISFFHFIPIPPYSHKMHSHPHLLTIKVMQPINGATFDTYVSCHIRQCVRGFFLHSRTIKIYIYLLTYLLIQYLLTVLHYRKPLCWLVCKSRSLPDHSRSKSSSQSPKKCSWFHLQVDYRQVIELSSRQTKKLTALVVIPAKLFFCFCFVGV